MDNIIERFKQQLIVDGNRRNFNIANYFKKVDSNTYSYYMEFNHSDYFTETTFKVNGDRVIVHYTCDYFCVNYPELCKNGIIDQTMEFEICEVDKFIDWYNSVAKTVYNPFSRHY